MIMLLGLTMLGTGERSRSQEVCENEELSFSHGVAFSFSQGTAATHWHRKEI